MSKKKSSYKPNLDMSTWDFLTRIPDEEAAESYLVQLRWRGKPVCPHCDSDNVAETKSGKPQPYRCRSCRKHFSVRTNTVMSQAKVPLHKFLYAVYLMVTNRKGIPATQLMREVGVTYKTAWFLAHRIRKAWEQDGGLFAGPVEIDETYVGGKEKNKHASKKLHAGRGAVGKAAVVGTITRRGGKVQAKHINSTDGETLKGFISDTTKKGEKVYTDEHKGYIGMVDFDHETVRHSVGEYVREQVHTNGIESFWALLKRGHYGVYHQMSEKHLHRYVDEFATRHNLRKQNTMAKLEHTFAGAVGRELHYKKLTDAVA